MYYCIVKVRMYGLPEEIIFCIPPHTTNIQPSSIELSSKYKTAYSYHIPINAHHLNDIHLIPQK